DADAQQQRKCNDVGKIQRRPDEHADLERDNDSNEKGYQGQRNIDPAAQRDKQDQRNQHHRQGAGLKECLDHGCGGLHHEKRGPRGACGATPRTAVTKRRKSALSLPSPFGTTSTRTRPSADIQVFFSSGGSVSMLIRSASRRRLAWRSVVLNGAIRACWASSRAAAGACTSGASTLARRRACTAAGLSKSRATSLSSALARRRVCAASASSTTSLPITAWVSAGVGSAPTSLGLRVFCRKKLASSIRASLASCSSGTKLCSVSTRPTSGNWRSFSAVAEAWARSLLSTSIVFGLVSGPFIKSSNVTTDSASCARRLSGLKSKRKPASSGK